MQKTYVVRNEAGTSIAEFTVADGPAFIGADARELPLRILRREKSGLLTVLLGDRVITGLLETRPPRGEFSIQTEGQRFIARVRDAALDAMEQRLGHTAQAGAAVPVTSPIPGTIKIIRTQPGASVRAGETVVVLEAMKMENEISAPVSGDIQTLRVHSGQAVAAGETLLIITASGAPS